MGLMDAIGGALGTNSSFQANPYQVDKSAYQWGGPSQQTLGGYLGNAQGQAGQDYSQSQAGNQAQSDYVNQLQNVAAGNGPSQAQGVLAQGANQAAGNAMSLARSVNNGNPAAQAAGLRAAMQQGANATVNAGANASQIKAQEQQAGLSMLGNAINTQRGQNLQSMGQNQQQAQGYLGAQMGQANAQLNAGMQQQAQNSENYNNAQSLNQATQQANAQANSAMLGSIAKGAGEMMAMSDARAKTDVEDAGANQSRSPGVVERGSNALSAFGSGLTGTNFSRKPIKPIKNMSGYDAKAKQQEMLNDRASQQYLPRQPPPPSLDQAMAQAAGGPPQPDANGIYPNGAPSSIAAVMAPDRPTWAGFGGAPQGPQEFAYPGGTGGMPGGLAIAMPPRDNAPPPYVPSGITMKTDVQPQSIAGPGQIDARMNPEAQQQAQQGVDEAKDWWKNQTITSDARAKEDAFQAGFRQGQEQGPHRVPSGEWQGGVLSNPARPYHPMLNAYYPTREYVGPGGAGLAMYEERPDASGHSKLVKEKVVDLADRAPIKSITPVRRDVLMPPEHQAPVASQRQAIEDAMRAQEAEPETIELDEEPQPTMERPANVQGYYSPSAPPGAPVGSALPRPPPPMTASRGYVPSDERMKTGIKTEADHFLETLTPYTYRYKDPSNEPSSQPTGGRYLGVMAQNVERAPEVGHQIVKDTPRGKVLEGGALMSALAGGLGRLNERVNAIESKRSY